MSQGKVVNFRWQLGAIAKSKDSEIPQCSLAWSEGFVISLHQN